MTFELHERVVRILAHDGESWRWSTGCCISRDERGATVLTTRHRLFDDPTFSITELEVRAGPLVLKVAPLKWLAFEEDDLVLIPVPGLDVPVCTIGGIRASETARPIYRSAGFPVAGERDEGVHDLVELSGELSPGDPRRSKLVQVEASSPPTTCEDWQGVSGAPVFVDGILVAVIREVPKRFGGGRLDAIALQRVVDRNPEFREALGGGATEESPSETLQRIAQAHFIATDRQLEGFVDELDVLLADGKLRRAEVVDARRLRRDIVAGLGAIGAHREGSPLRQTERARRPAVAMGLATAVASLAVLLLIAIKLWPPTPNGSPPRDSGGAMAGRDAELGSAMVSRDSGVDDAPSPSDARVQRLDAAPRPHPNDAEMLTCTARSGPHEHTGGCEIYCGRSLGDIFEKDLRSAKSEVECIQLAAKFCSGFPKTKICTYYFSSAP